MTVEAPPSRRRGRILSLGFALPGVNVDNYNFLTAPAFFDYDALVVDPRALSELIDGVIDGSVEARTYTGHRVSNDVSDHAAASLAAVLRRRRDETDRLLRAGGVVVCFAHPPVTHGGIAAMDATDDLFWLRDAPRPVAGEGSNVHVVDYQHPLAAFVLSQLANIAYTAHFPLDAAADDSVVFARSYGGAAVGVEPGRAAGRLAFIPALRAMPSSDARYTMSDTLQAGIRRMIGVMAEGRAPTWLAAHTLPGLEERAGDLARASQALAAAQSALDEAEKRHDELDRHRRLLWQEGALGLEDVAVEALRLLGFQVYANDPAAIELRDGDTRIFVEIEGGDGAIGMAPHYRLRQRIERAIERGGGAPRGLLLINGYRREPPEKRPPQASDGLRTAAETMRYCIATTAGLFDAVAAKLTGDDAAVAEYRRSVATTDGCREAPRPPDR